MKVLVTIPDKLCDIIDELVKEGDYNTRSAFVSEAVLSHLRSWYPSKVERQTQK